MNGRARIDAVFRADRKADRVAFIPYFVAGFPSMRKFRNLLWDAHDAGSTCIELGLPFSDPVADGPVLQGAMVKARKNGVTVRSTLDEVRSLRKEGFEAPIMAMTYANLLVSAGLAKTSKRWSQAGLDGVLVPDVPWEEAPPVRAALRKQGLGTVAFASPGTSRTRLRSIVNGPDSFTYLVAVYGITGARKDVAPETKELLHSARRERRRGGPPLCVGFGVSEPRHVRHLAKSGAEGVIVGSALARPLADGHDAAPILRSLARACSTSSPAKL